MSRRNHDLRMHASTDNCVPRERLLSVLFWLGFGRGRQVVHHWYRGCRMGSRQEADFALSGSQHKKKKGNVVSIHINICSRACRAEFSDCFPVVGCWCLGNKSSSLRVCIWSLVPQRKSKSSGCVEVSRYLFTSLIGGNVFASALVLGEYI